MPHAAKIERLSAFRKTLNLRDLGGYIGADGRTVKHGLLFRSGALGQATPAELEAIRQLGLQFVLDLRSSTEADELPDPTVPDAYQVRISGAMDANDVEIDMSPNAMYRILFNPRRVDPDPEDSIISAIAEIYSSLAFNNIAYKELMQRMEQGKAPLLFHCTCGKDRTGVAAIIILLALGVDPQTIADDFELTNQYLQENIDAKLADHDFLSRFGAFRYVVEVTEGVKRSFGERVMDEILQEYGSFDVYLETEFGLDEQRLAALRDKYLE